MKKMSEEEKKNLAPVYEGLDEILQLIHNLTDEEIEAVLDRHRGYQESFQRDLIKKLFTRESRMRDKKTA